MLNHFRTLLLNLGYVGDANEHISNKFTGPLALPKELQNFYDAVFPAASSRFYKRFIVTNLLEIVDSTQYNNVVTEIDKRITYNIDTQQEFFKVHRFSNPIISNTAFPIFVFGEYHNNIALDDLSDEILITQQTNTSVVDVYSVTKNVFYIQNLTLVFTNNLSQSVQIPGTDLTFQIGGNNFTGTSNKKWRFLVESPFEFNFNNLYTDLINRTSVTEAMLGYNRGTVDETYENIWRRHHNPVYRMAGLLISYVNRINTLI